MRTVVESGCQCAVLLTAAADGAPKRAVSRRCVLTRAVHRWARQVGMVYRYRISATNLSNRHIRVRVEQHGLPCVSIVYAGTTLAPVRSPPPPTPTP
jgi:hypothetical protein